MPIFSLGKQLCHGLWITGSSHLVAMPRASTGKPLYFWARATSADNAACGGSLSSAFRDPVTHADSSGGYSSCALGCGSPGADGGHAELRYGYATSSLG
jgi:hypothetical protein